MLIRGGYDQSYIYHYCKKTFSSRDINDTSPIDTFVDNFDFNKHSYEIRFRADKKVYNFRDILEQRLKINIVNESTSHTNTKGTINLTYSENDVDFFATMYEGECYLVPFQDCGKRAQRLRIIPTKNGQTKGITFAKDYHLKDVIKRL